MKLRHFLILVFCAGLILLGSFGPKLAGAWTDSRESALVSYATITDVRLDLDSGKDRLSMRQKLPLLARYDSSTQIPESLTAHTHQELRSSIQSILEPYIREALLPEFSSADVARGECQAFLVYRDESQTFSNIFWNFRLESSEVSLEMILDDETLGLCSLTCRRKTPEPSAVPDPDAGIEVLCRLYLEGLGEAFGQFEPEILAAGAQKNVAPYADGEARSLHFQWSDLVFGETTVNILLSPDSLVISVF